MTSWSSPVSETPSGPIRVTDLALYLRKAGWHRIPHPNERLLFFELPQTDAAGQPLRTVLPARDDYEDAATLIGNTVDLIAALRGVEPRQIAQGVRSIDRDILSVRFMGAQASYGNLRLDTAMLLVQQLRDLLAYAACVEEYPRPYFPRASAIGRKYTESCFFGHTFPGSFGFTIESPTGPAMTPEAANTTAPFERRVMVRVLRGISDLSQALLSGDPNILVSRYETGLNANMCEALESALKQADESEMEYSVIWSPEWPLPQGVGIERSVRLQPGAATFLGAAARQMRSLEESTVRTISGRVVALHADDSANNERVATILWEEQPKRRFRVRVDLEPEDYARACDAHKSDVEVSVSGRLEKQGKFWTLMSPSDFRVRGDVLADNC